MATNRKGRGKWVFCSRCAELLLIKGVLPICVALAQFERGPLRERIGIKGYMSAEKRNRYNNYKRFRIIDFKSVAKKRFVINKLSREGINVESSSLQQYSIKAESLHKKKICRTQHFSKGELDKAGVQKNESAREEESKIKDGGRFEEGQFKQVRRRLEQIKKDSGASSPAAASEVSNNVATGRLKEQVEGSEADVGSVRNAGGRDISDVAAEEQIDSEKS